MQRYEADERCGRTMDEYTVENTHELVGAPESIPDVEVSDDSQHSGVVADVPATGPIHDEFNEELSHNATAIETFLLGLLTEESDWHLRQLLIDFRQKEEDELVLSMCDGCNRAFIGGGQVVDRICKRCRDPKKSTQWQFANDMDPGPQSDIMRDSTPMARSLIAPIHTTARLTRAKRGGQYKSKGGHVIHLPVNTTSIYNRLPLLPVKVDRSKSADMVRVGITSHSKSTPKNPCHAPSHHANFTRSSTDENEWISCR